MRFPDTVPRLEAAGLLLRELTEADIPAWYARATDAESADLAGDPIPDSIAMGAAWLARHRERFAQQSAIRWAVVADGGDECAGTVGLVNIARDGGTADFAIVIGRAWWGRGVGTRAGRLALDYAFAALGLDEIRAEVLQRNAASIRLLDKLGFVRVRAVPAGAAADDEDMFEYALRRAAAT